MTGIDKEKGEVKLHRKPKKLPPRSDLRRHLSDEEEEDKDLKKEAVTFDRASRQFEDWSTTPQIVDRSHANGSQEDYQEANVISAQQMDAIISDAKLNVNRFLLDFDESQEVAARNALDLTLGASQGGKWDHKISGDLYNYILARMLEKKDLKKTAGAIDDLVVKRDKVRSRLEKVQKNLSQVDKMHSDLKLSFEVEKKALADVALAIEDEILRVTKPTEYNKELFKRECTKTLKSAGTIKRRTGTKIAFLGFEEDTHYPVFSMKLFSIFDGKSDRRIMVDKEKKVQGAHYKQLLEDSAGKFKKVVGMLKKIPCKFELQTDGKVKVEAMRGSYVLTSSKFFLKSASPVDNSYRRKKVLDELSQVLGSVQECLSLVSL